MSSSSRRVRQELTDRLAGLSRAQLRRRPSIYRSLASPIDWRLQRPIVHPPRPVGSKVISGGEIEMLSVVALLDVSACSGEHNERPDKSQYGQFTSAVRLSNTMATSCPLFPKLLPSFELCNSDDIRGNRAPATGNRRVRAESQLWPTVTNPSQPAHNGSSPARLKSILKAP